MGSLSNPARWLICLIGVSAGLWVWQHDQETKLRRIVVHAMIESGSDTLELWMNDTYRAPLMLEVSSQELKRYEFPVRDGRISFLRLDPGMKAQTTLGIESISIEDGPRIVKKHLAEDIAKWVTVGISKAEIRHNVLFVTTNTSDPQIMSAIEPVDLEKNALIRYLVDRLALRETKPDTFSALVMMCAILMLLSCFATRALWAEGFTVILAVCGAFVATQTIRLFAGSPPDTVQAVGWAAFTGYPKSLDFLVVPALVLTATASAAAVHYLRVYWEHPEKRVDRIDGTERSRESKWTVVGICGLTALIVAYHIPGLSVEAELERNGVLSADWDSMNVVTWTYFIQTGRLPYRDFWFPYSGMILCWLEFPYGSLIASLRDSLVLSFFLLSLQVCTRRFQHTVVIFAPIFFLYAFWPAMHRYLPIVTILLAFSAIDPDRDGFQPAHAVFWGAALEGFFFEVTLAVITGIPIWADVMTILWARRRRLNRSLVSFMAWSFLPIAAAILCLVLVMHYYGMAKGLLDFLLSGEAMTAYGAFPAPIPDWLLMIPWRSGLVLWAGILLTALGFLAVRSSGEIPDALSRAVLMLGLANMVFMVKQITRPNIDIQMTMIPTIGAMIYMLSLRMRMSKFQGLVAYFFIGAIAVGLWADGTVRPVFDGICSSAARVAQAVHTLSGLSAAERKALTRARWEAERFRSMPEYSKVVGAMGTDQRSDHKEPLYVLGDDAYLYILTGADPPYHTNLYNSSPLTEQRRILEYLQKRTPAAVVWRSSQISFDGVPFAVRNPVIMGEITCRYAPGQSVGDFVILKRLDSQPPAIPFWKEKLGSRLHLGRIPDHDRLDSYGPCPDRS
ncbi:MAG: hypothetical protein V2B18_10740, partial [Pseudomonadota bacterium]